MKKRIKVIAIVVVLAAVVAFPVYGYFKETKHEAIPKSMPGRAVMISLGLGMILAARMTNNGFKK